MLRIPHKFYRGDRVPRCSYHRTLSDTRSNWSYSWPCGVQPHQRWICPTRPYIHSQLVPPSLRIHCHTCTISHRLHWRRLPSSKILRHRPSLPSLGSCCIPIRRSLHRIDCIQPYSFFWVFLRYLCGGTVSDLGGSSQSIRAWIVRHSLWSPLYRHCTWATFKITWSESRFALTHSKSTTVWAYLILVAIFPLLLEGQNSISLEDHQAQY